jgi:hypothetical protein
VNGKKVGEHKGGSDPLSFNVTPYLNKAGEQEIVMCEEALWLMPKNLLPKSILGM